MAMANETAHFVQPCVVVVSRTFPAPRELVFQAWTSAEHVKNWFCPACFTVPEAEVEFRVGGAFNVCMRGPDGHDNWTRGRYSEIDPPNRLVLDMDVIGPGDQTVVRAHTVVSFAEVAGGTRMEVRQTYTLLVPDAEQMIQGAPEGWEQTLDRLEREVARMQDPALGRSLQK
jgi:uncharacterized protein YndB with AHSA1/START domain